MKKWTQRKIIWSFKIQDNTDTSITLDTYVENTEKTADIYYVTGESHDSIAIHHLLRV